MLKLGQMMKQAQEMQGKMQEMQEKLMSHEVEGQSGAGLVKVSMNGKGDLKSLIIDPSLLKEDEGEILQDLILAAHADAKVKVEAYIQEKTQEAMGGLNLPEGFKMPF
ncbi:YbaB/EbfC family nucleoid-associated protein [Curvivirga aplysinae]|uniref:YbaB/EbfC family nucleoid-associated protein n=1 Tax=Curvivirga aplysinae TaxID=2529852 RepID=UPI0012BC03D6|nr:YbaB/EbfC family nucleoid-associated protein [Curvivirga aplysinae]MTI10629.1 YbaB/EbfC family nucleoid-associated protein [Curvivirga aplysinae]